MATRTNPVVFVHGLWLHATSWTPWVEVFRDTGYNASAPGWPGDPDSAEHFPTTMKVAWVHVYK